MLLLIPVIAHYVCSIPLCLQFIMVALCNRADHYIFALLFLSIYLSSIFLFSSPKSAAVGWVSTIL